MGRRTIKIIKLLIVMSILVLSLAITVSFAKEWPSVNFGTVTSALSSNKTRQTSDGKTKIYIPYSDLRDKANILCSQYMTHLPSIGDTNVPAWNGHGPTNKTDKGTETAYLTEADLRNGETVYKNEAQWTEWTTEQPNIPDGVTSETIALYDISEEITATPKEAYILSYINGDSSIGLPVNAGYDEDNSVQQQAWWRTIAGGNSGGDGSYNWLYQEATNFENYIEEVTNHNIQYNDDHTVKIDYKTSMDSSNAKVLFDSTTNTYKIGPLTVNYLRSVSKAAGSRNGTVSFAGIDDSSMIGLDKDGNDVPISSDNYRYVYSNHRTMKTGDTEESYPYPYDNEEFFIELDYIENITAIKSFKFDFKYMNAGASYEKLNGTYLKINWAGAAEMESEIRYTENNSSSAFIQNNETSQIAKLSNQTEYSIQKVRQINYLNEDTYNMRPTLYKDLSKSGAYYATFAIEITVPSEAKWYNQERDQDFTSKVYSKNVIESQIKVEPNCSIRVDQSTINSNENDIFYVYLTNCQPNTEYKITFPTGSIYATYGVRQTLYWDEYVNEFHFNNTEFSKTIKTAEVPKVVSSPKQKIAGEIAWQQRMVEWLKKGIDAGIESASGNAVQQLPEWLKKGLEAGIEAANGNTSGNGTNTSTSQNNSYENEDIEGTYYYRYKYYLTYNGVESKAGQRLINCVGGKIEEISVDLLNAGGGSGTEDLTVEFVTEPWDLTTSISGMVWKDRTEDKKTGGFGTYQTEEDLLDKIEVKIYKVYYDTNGQEKDRELAKAYKTKSTENDKVLLNDLIDFNSTDKANRLFTGINGQEKGKYKVYLPVPGVAKDDTEHAGLFATYDVEFTYDGQNYEPTEFLMSTAKSSVGDKLTEFENTNTAGAEKDYEKYAKDSYVIESESDRKTFDEKFGQVYGQSPVANNKTEGKSAKLNNTEEKTLNYNSDIDNGTSRLRSQLETLDSDGYVLDQYKLSSRTSTSGLALPYTKYYHVDEDNFDNVIIQNNTYQPVSEYFNQINLGLLERNLADIGITKDLYKASVVVNEKELITKYNQTENLTGDSLKIQIDLGKKIQNYPLGLYNSDFYYRSNVYKYNPNGEDEAYNIEKDIIGTIKEGTELRVFATYKISLYNESEYFDVTVNNLNDYYDKTFTLVSDDIKDEIINEAGERETKVIADKTYYRITNGGKYSYNKAQDIENCTNGTIDWKQNNDSGQYHMMNTNSLVGVKIPAGERLEIFVTYEVDKEGYEKAKTENYDEATQRENLLNSKNNIAEVTNYSTYYSKASEERHNTTSYKAGNVAGRIDRDSAPGNIVIGDKSLWEDDTAGAPVFNIQLKDGIDREINGVVWEDSQTKELQYSQKVGDGIYNNNEKGIEGVNVTLVEKIPVDIDGTNIEFEYVWPNDAFGKEIPGYTSMVTTNKDGIYQLKDFVSGTYVVRFEYGNNEATINAGYNGQDYKNTGYQMGYKNTSEENTVVNKELNVPGAETLNNVYHDLSNNKEANDLNSARVSDARDYEPRRMEVIAYSRTISNSNAEVLAGKDNKELIDATAMVANTAKLNIEIENPNTIQYNSQDKDIKVVDGNNQASNTYKINNIDFGLEKRSETKIDLKKKISKITLTKLSDSTPIMTVAINDDGTIDTEKSTSLEKLMHVPSTDDVQGFDWINIEDNYLTDLGIRIEYKIVVTNNSEVDWTGEELSKLYTPGQIVSNAKNLEGNLENAGAYVLSDSKIKYGQYLGLNYYTNEYYGKEGTTYNVGGMEYNADKIVKTTVDQVADYIDKDIGLDDEYNNNIENHAWYLANNSEIDGTTGKVKSLDGIISEGSYSENESDKKQYLLDTNGVAYVTNNKSNIALSENTMISDEDENYTYNSLTIKNIGRYSDGRFSGSEITETEKPVIAYKGFKSYKKSPYNPTGSNKDFIKELTPASYDKNNSSSSIGLTTSVQVQSGTAAENMNYDNMAEIVIYSNTVGRRTPDSIPGNAIERVNKLSEERDNGSGILYAAAKLEPDTDATEYVTFTEPTGLSYALESQNIYITVLLIALIVLAVGVIVITISVVTVKTKNSKIE